MPCSKAPAIDFALSDVQLTGSAGLAVVATSASWLDLNCPLARRVRVRCRYTDQDCGQRWMRMGSGCRCRSSRSSW